MDELRAEQMRNKRSLLEVLGALRGWAISMCARLCIGQGLRARAPVEQPIDDSRERQKLELAQLRLLQHTKEQTALQLAVTEYIENIPKNWLLVKQEHARDVETYRISALRYGDFLSVMMERYIGEKLTQYALMVNLSKTNEIVTKIGSAPMLDGEAFFSVITIYGEPQVMENSAFEYQRDRGFLTQGAGYIPERCSDDSDIIHGAPVPARDDTIIFSGVDIKLAIPHGRLDDALMVIQKAIKKGYKPKGLPKVKQ